MILRGTAAPYPTANHSLAKQIVKQHPQALIGLEQLTDIRERTQRKKRRRKKNGKGYEQVSPKARKANRVYSQWSFAELHDLISYKAALCGGLSIKVDADYTSKACPVCGHTADENRPRKGLLFACQNPRCRYALHADLIGARNVAMRTLLVRHDWIRTGCLLIWDHFNVGQTDEHTGWPLDRKPDKNTLVDTTRFVQ